MFHRVAALVDSLDEEEEEEYTSHQSDDDDSSDDSDKDSPAPEEEVNGGGQSEGFGLGTKEVVDAWGGAVADHDNFIFHDGQAMAMFSSHTAEDAKKKEAKMAARGAQQKLTQELLREKEELVKKLKDENEELHRERDKRLREAEYFKNTAMQARDALLKLESDMRVSSERYASLERDMAAHHELSKHLLDEKERELQKALKASALHHRGDARAGSSEDMAGKEDRVAETQQSKELERLRAEREQCDAKAAAREDELMRALDAKEREISTLQQEVQHLRDLQRRLSMDKDELRIALETVEESLKGETLAHGETTAALRSLREEKARLVAEMTSQKALHAATQRQRVDTIDHSNAGNRVLEDEMGSPGSFQIQDLSRRVLELEASLSAARNDTKEWKESYERLARRENERGGGASGSIDDRTMRALFNNSSIESKGTLRRSKRLTQLARKGRPGRAAVAVLSSVDDLFIDVLQSLTVKTTWRLMATYYLGFLHFVFFLTIFTTRTCSCRSTTTPPF